MTPIILQHSTNAMVNEDILKWVCSTYVLFLLQSLTIDVCVCTYVCVCVCVRVCVCVCVHVLEMTTVCPIIPTDSKDYGVSAHLVHAGISTAA